MYPNIPYEGLSWPITQHAGVLKAEVSFRKSWMDGSSHMGMRVKKEKQRCVT